MAQTTVRYPGPRWSLAYGSYEGVEQFALQELYGMVQHFHPYVVQVAPVNDKTAEGKDHLILVGTPQSNPLIAELVATKRIALPEQPQGYTLTCGDSPWDAGRRLLVIAGSDPRGVLYGVEDLNARVLATGVLPEKPTPPRLRAAFDSIGDFVICEYPLIERRGIWTWGYVIYDYARFIDHMARLRMTTLIIWSDCPPVNCEEVIERAHSRGIHAILGFAWGWGMAGLDISRADDQRQIKKWVLNEYSETYRNFDIDGIYFQTLTEHHDTERAGKSAAAVICEMVNDISSALFALDPDLRLHFGLHATSIGDHFIDLESLDPRIEIVWEDAGVIPYSYTPTVELPSSPGEHSAFGTVERTIEFSRKVAKLREGAEFAMVAKGWTSLNWPSEGQHHGSFLLGERGSQFIRERARQRQPEWDRVNRLWTKNHGIASQFYREILECAPASMTVVGLIEDGMLEEQIQFSVALFSEMIWNPRRADEDLVQMAMSPYYRM